jgi:GAF domain-containing protein
MRELMDHAAGIMGTANATVQLIEPDFQYLKIVAQRGFAPEFEDHFRLVDRCTGTMCGRALLERAPIIVEDALLDAASQCHRHVFEHANVRAVVSIPVITRHGAFYGMVSTHKPVPDVPSRLQMQELEAATAIGAEAIVRVRARRRMAHYGL